MSFQGAFAKLTIGSLEPEALDLVVEAQYNPKELQIDKPVPWLEAPEMNLEFQGIKSRTFAVELLLDGFEHTRSVMPQVEILEKLSSPRDPKSRREQLRRPHRCVVVWGDRGMPRLRCVIEQLAVKFVMWTRDGLPVRAVCTLQLKECVVSAEEARAARRQLQPGIVRVS